MIMSEKEYYSEIISILNEKHLSKEETSRLKIKLCKKHGMKKIPTDIQIMLNGTQDELKGLNLVTKPTRTISGVSVVAMMTKPFECPHGECSMCPSNIKKGVPQSYTGKEPATMRGIRNKFDSYIQVFNRIEQYVVLGQNFDKIELIVMGGTFPSFPKKYRDEFVGYSFKAMNDFSKLFFKKSVFNIVKFKEFFMLPGDINDENRTKQVQEKILKIKGELDLKFEQKRNENSNIKCVGLTIETRPDYGMLKEGNDLLRLGCTRVELGIQSVYDDALKKIDRGHAVADSIKSIKILKDLGFKLNFHYMPGLPGVDKQKDLEGMKELFSNPNFCPDMIKIYPCMVIPDTKLFDEFEKGNFIPISTKDAMEIIKEFKKFIPPYCRVMRVQRDIPTYMTKAGVDKTNLRQMIDQSGHECNCIRCREVGHVNIKKKISPENIEIRSSVYDASLGKEYFISAEDFNKNILLGFCRLRFPSESLTKEITENSAIIRELHVYGRAIGIGEKGTIQHEGWGKKLLKKAEDIAKSNHKDKIVIISGIGVRNYYRKLGYKLLGTYMVKKL